MVFEALWMCVCVFFNLWFHFIQCPILFYSFAFIFEMMHKNRKTNINTRLLWDEYTWVLKFSLNLFFLNRAFFNTSISSNGWMNCTGISNGQQSHSVLWKFFPFFYAMSIHSIFMYIHHHQHYNWVQIAQRAENVFQYWFRSENS